MEALVAGEADLDAPEGEAAALEMVFAADGGATGTTARVGFAPIVRVDAARRELELCATSEAVDSYGTVFDYAASKAAFTRWLGNVREMHERRAVGRRVGIRCDDAERRIYVRVRISRGAEDTWEKVLDGTLRGASIGASNVVWSRQVRSIAGQERQLQVATRYDLVELSLVDNPSNPDALGIMLVRDAVPDAAVLDDLAPSASLLWQSGEPEQLAGSAEMAAVEERARGPFSPNTEGYPDVGVPERSEERPTSELGLGPQGNARERFHAAARAILSGCGCPLCAGALAALGDVGAASEAARAARTPEMAGDAREDALARALAAGLSASVARLEQVDASVRGLGAVVASTVESAMELAVRSATQRATEATGELRQRIEALEAQPLPGGPVLRVAEKTHPLLGASAAIGGAGQPGPSEQYRALESLAGRLTDPQAQIAVAAEMIRLQRGE